MSQKLKILQLCHKPPVPARDGGCIAMNNVTQGLLEAGHEVRVMTIYTQKHDLDIDSLPKEYLDKTGIKGVFIDTTVNLVDAFASLITQDSYNVSRFFSADFDILLANLLRRKKFDIIHLESLFMTPYIGTCRRHSKAKIVLRSHNLEHVIWERVAGGTKGLAKRAYLKYLSRKLKDYELSVIGMVDGIAAISEEDCSKYEALGCEKPVVNIPFGVDAADYAKHENVKSHLKVFHLGSMDWTPNLEGILWFLEDVWPKAIKHSPNLKLFLAGRQMPSDLLYSSHEGVEILGEVDSAVEFMNDKGIMIVPLHSASGVRVKIIEGMAMGKAIISTKVGAEGIDYTDGENILIASTPEEFKDKLAFLADNPEEVARIGANAHELVKTSFDNTVITQNLLSFFTQLLNR